MASIDQSNLKNQIHKIMFLKNESSRPLFKPGFGSAEVFMRIRIQYPKNVIMDPDADPDPSR